MSSVQHLQDVVPRSQSSVFPRFLWLRPFTEVPPVVVTPTITLLCCYFIIVILLLLGIVTKLVWTHMLRSTSLVKGIYCHFLLQWPVPLTGIIQFILSQLAQGTVRLSCDFASCHSLCASPMIRKGFFTVLPSRWFSGLKKQDLEHAEDRNDLLVHQLWLLRGSWNWTEYREERHPGGSG